MATAVVIRSASSPPILVMIGPLLRCSREGWEINSVGATGPWELCAWVVTVRWVVTPVGAKPGTLASKSLSASLNSPITPVIGTRSEDANGGCLGARNR